MIEGFSLFYVIRGVELNWRILEEENLGFKIY